MMHWENSRADKAFRSLRGLSEVNSGLEMGAGPHIAAHMSDLLLTEAELEGIKRSLTHELRSPRTWLTRKASHLGALAWLGTLAVLLLADTKYHFWAWAAGLAMAIAMNVAVYLLRRNRPRVVHMDRLLEQLERGERPLAYYARMLSEQRTRPEKEQVHALNMQLAHLLMRNTPVRRLEDENVHAMAALSAVPPAR